MVGCLRTCGLVVVILAFAMGLALDPLWGRGSGGAYTGILSILAMFVAGLPWTFLLLLPTFAFEPGKGGLFLMFSLGGLLNCYLLCQPDRRGTPPAEGKTGPGVADPASPGPRERRPGQSPPD